MENYAAALDEILRLKPSAAKGRDIRKGTLITTMGPGIPLDPSITRNLTAEFEGASAELTCSDKGRLPLGGALCGV